MTGAWDFAVELRSDPASAEARAAVLADPAFGQSFTDHMVVANWTVDRGWQDANFGHDGCCVGGCDVFGVGENLGKEDDCCVGGCDVFGVDEHNG